MWLPLVFTSHLHDILVVHLFNAGLPCMASARALNRTQPVASVTHWLPCEAVHSASDLSRRSHLLILKLRGPYEVDCVPAWQDSKLPQPTRKGWLGSSLCENQRESAICSPQVWNGYGTGMERYRTGSGTKQPAPAQHCHHAAHLYQNWQFGARIAQQEILRLPAGSSQAHLYHQTSQLCHSGQQL